MQRVFKAYLQTLRNFSAAFDVKAALGEFAVGDVKITAREHPHGATTALAFRIEEAGKVFVYASDVGYPDGGPGALLDVYRGADVLLHDTTYRPSDQATRRDRGFSSYEEACDAAIAAGVKRLVTFHYDQDYTDDDVDQIVAAGVDRGRERAHRRGQANELVDRLALGAQRDQERGDLRF